MGNLDSLTEAVDPTAMRAQARVGTTLRGKWHLDRLLGLGGMAAVYAATHRNGSRVAVKVLYPELSTHGHVRSRFLKEGYVANKVDHPGVVRVLDDDVAEDGSLFLVMELLDGESLEERRERLGGKLDVDEVLAAADQLLDVLAAAHTKGIVHRDIKPENVFLTRDGVIKVLDFGIARLRELSTASSATRVGTTMGTPAFMAPEHARGLWDEVDPRSDLWSVGALMFALASGRLVHEGRTTNEILLGAMSKPAPSLSTVLKVPDHVAAVVDRALAYAKEQRWPDARSMQEAVRRAFHGLHGAPISTHPRLTVPPTVPNRTLASADAVVPAGLGSAGTGPAVASGRTGVALRLSTASGLPRGAIIAGGIAGLGAFLVVVIVVISVVGTRSRLQAAGSGVEPGPVAASSTDSGAGPDAPSTTVVSASGGAPVVALKDLPTAGSANLGAPKPDAGAKPPAPGPTDWMEQRR